MQENQNNELLLSVVWVFNGNNNHFPSGVFTDQKLAEEWIEKNKLTGTLTAYPLNQGIYDWAIERGYFKPKRGDQTTPSFIGNFSSAYQNHHHYEDGE
jgi:hypothetical protein